MKLSSIITEIRDHVEDRTTNRWGDAQLTRTIHTQTMKLVRRMVDVDENYSNVRISLDKSVATAVKTDMQFYTLPPWTYKVVSVREGTTSNTTQGRVVPKAQKLSNLQGWRMGAGTELVLSRYGNALDLDIEIAKVPARLTLGTLPDQTGMAANQLRMDTDSSSDAATYPHETAPNSYAGAVVEVVETGEILRCTLSEHRQDYSGTPYTVLTFREDWMTAPVAGNTYEMHCAEINDTHMRYLTLLCAAALLQREGNNNQLQSIMLEISEEAGYFTRHIQRRDVQRPTLIAADDAELRETQLPWFTGMQDGY